LFNTFFANDFTFFSREELRKINSMELKLTHENPTADEPTNKRDEATKALSDDDVQQPIV
jgi:CO dehydrogenase/acetyl-CoA synthase beta subunit